MAFAEMRFPESISYGSTGGPSYSTDIVTTESGHEKRNNNWQNARASYQVIHGVKTEEQVEELINFFRSCKGMAHGFRFKDWSDYKANSQEIAVGDGVETSFQLVKHYETIAGTETRPIKKPVEGSVILYIDGSEVNNSFYSVDYSYGVINFLSSPSYGQIIKADFEFDVPVRFDTDQMEISLDAYGIHSWGNIPLIEIR